MKPFWYLSLASMMILSSCTEVMDGPDSSEASGKYSCQIPSAIESVKAVWLPGDKLVVHGEYAKDQQTITLTEGDISSDGKICYIDIAGIPPYKQKAIKAEYFIGYPGEMVSNQSHCKDATTFSGTNAVLAGGYNKNKTFVLEPVTGGFEFSVTGDYDSYELKGNNDEAVGYSSLTSRITETAKIYVQSKGNNQKSITGDVIADGAAKNTICMVGEPELADGFLMVLYKGNTPAKIFYTEQQYNIKRGTFVSLGDITSQLIDYKAPEADTHVSSIPKEEAMDLSAQESANCYMVTAPGVYAFKAVKGNSSESVGSLGSVDVLWETWGTTEKPSVNSVVSAVDFEQDMIYFRIADDFHAGNAVIAAKTDMGAVLWSWHIWVPETLPTESLYGLSQNMTMSRNLGALVDASATGASAKSAGLLYQWGRKDPFVGAGDLDVGGSAAVAGKERTLYGGKMTVAKSVKNPTAFANNKGIWNTSAYETLWESYKTIYDPCPPGYKVPQRSENMAFQNSPADIYGWDFSASGHVFSVGNPAAYYPLSGCLDYNGELQYCGTAANLWCTSIPDDVTTAYNLRITKSSSGASYGNSGRQKAFAYSVRCVALEETPFENAPGLPVFGNYEKYKVAVSELSGVCLDVDGEFLWGIGDNGVLAKLDFTGKVLEKTLVNGMDMEGITMDPQTKDIYLGMEGNQAVFRVPAPDYNKAEFVFDVKMAIEDGYGNSGVEGVAWYKDDMILVGTQWGARMWAYKLVRDDNGKVTGATEVWNRSMRTVAVGMDEIADICYDPIHDHIWIADSNTRMIYVFNGDATEHIASYSEDFIGNGETVYIDYKHNCVWLADDWESSEMYRMDFE